MKSDYVETLSKKKITDGIYRWRTNYQTRKINWETLLEVNIKGWTGRGDGENIFKEISHLKNTKIF